LPCFRGPKCFECDDIEHVVLTTDSDKISNIAKQLFPDVIIVKRPKELALDSSTSEDALYHAILQIDKTIENISTILFVQATSPLTTKDDFANMLHIQKKNDSVMFYTEDYGYFTEINDMKKPRIPRQERVPLTREAGNAWSFSKSGFLKSRCRLFGQIGLCKIDPIKSYEIDEVSDLKLLECLIKSSFKEDES